MRICPTCRTTYPAKGRATCTKDGTRLVDAREFAEAQADTMIRKIVAGRYHVQQRIGVGGMGTVYRASQAGLDRPVALKILKKELAWDQDTVTRFHREAKAMSLLTHPNTVRVYDFGETAEGLLYFAMELLEGELLTSRVERDGAVDVRDAIGFTRQVLGSLHEAHSKGIIHRDLKPDNIFLARVEGHDAPIVKVLDFGIAKVFQGDKKIDQLETQAGTVFGTPRYMSPEQAQGKTLDPRSDLYSVGILLYHMLTGRPPFVDDDAVVVMAKHIREKPDSVRKVAPDRPIPHSLDKLVARAIDKEPAKRFKSAEELSRKLEATLPDVERAMHEQREGRTGGFRAFVRDMRGPLAIAGSLVAVALVVFVVIVAGTGEANEIEPVQSELGPATDGDPQPGAPTAIERGQDDLDARQTIAVTTVPPGAEVWWNGERLDHLTPYAELVRPGTVMEVELRKDGYETARARIEAGADQPTIELRRVATPTPATTEPAAPRTRPRERLGDTVASGMSAADQAPAPSMRPADPYEEW